MNFPAYSAANPMTCYEMTAAAGDNNGDGDAEDAGETAVDVNGDGEMDAADFTAARANACMAR